jgi:HEAT repeat protein
MKIIKPILMLLFMLVLMNITRVSCAEEKKTSEEIETFLKFSNFDEIVKIGEPAVEPLIYLLKNHRNPPIRWNAAKVLGMLKDPRAVEPLIGAFDDNSSLINLTAVKMLSEMGKPAVEPLINALKNKKRPIRDYSSMTLGHMKDPDVVKRLITVMKDDDAYARGGAAYALGKIGDISAVEPIIAMLKDENEYVVKRAAGALKDITKKDFGTDQAKWQEWWKENKAK